MPFGLLLAWSLLHLNVLTWNPFVKVIEKVISTAREKVSIKIQWCVPFAISLSQLFCVYTLLSIDMLHQIINTLSAGNWFHMLKKTYIHEKYTEILSKIHKYIHTNELETYVSTWRKQLEKHRVLLWETGNCSNIRPGVHILRKHLLKTWLDMAQISNQLNLCHLRVHTWIKVSHFIEMATLDPEIYLYTLEILRHKILTSQVSRKTAKN